LEPTSVKNDPKIVSNTSTERQKDGELRLLIFDFRFFDFRSPIFRLSCLFVDFRCSMSGPVFFLPPAEPNMEPTSVLRVTIGGLGVEHGRGRGTGGRGTPFNKLLTTNFLEQTSYNKLLSTNFLQQTSYNTLITADFSQQTPSGITDFYLFPSGSSTCVDAHCRPTCGRDAD
jgi:hypothetical protein